MVFSVTIIVGKKTVPGNYTVKHRSLLYDVRLFCVCVLNMLTCLCLCTTTPHAFNCPLGPITFLLSFFY